MPTAKASEVNKTKPSGTIGDAAITQALDVFESTGARGTIEHAQLMQPSDVVRMARVARWAYDRWPAPIWVTENGTCDATDRFRAQYLHDHLEVMAAARATGLPFERYYHWCFVDNWEWAEGEVPRFGIVELNFATLERTVKSSGRFYADVIAEGGVTDEISARYLSS